MEKKPKLGVSSPIDFIHEVAAEGKKASWPTRQELMSSTIAVIASVVLLSVFVGLCDEVLVLLLKFLTRVG